MERLKIDAVGYDPKYYPRVNGKEDWLTCHRYTEALLAHPWKADANRKGAFPPVVVVAGGRGCEWEYLLLDGLHRLRAFHRASLEEIWAVVEDLPQSKWLARSAELNMDGKRGLDAGDKRWVAMRLEKEGWRSEKIAFLLDMTPASFEKLRMTNIQKITTKQAKAIPEGRGNREVNGGRYGFLKAPFSEATGTANAEAVLMHQGSVTAHDAAQIVDSFVTLLESGCYDLTDEGVAAGLKKAKKLLDEAL